jgi:hypothetical protein
MLLASVNLVGMAKKSDKPGPGRPKGRKPFAAFSLRMEPARAESLRQYVKGLRPQTTVTAIINMLVEEFMQKHGIEPVSNPPKEQ